MHLKYTYGVNAWKHWVVQKNASMEKPSGRGKVKLFRTDLLQCTADELNFSLCLFVKEVRKPNGEEYAPDSIYYLCLGKTWHIIFIDLFIYHSLSTYLLNTFFLPLFIFFVSFYLIFSTLFPTTPLMKTWIFIILTGQITVSVYHTVHHISRMGSIHTDWVDETVDCMLWHSHFGHFLAHKNIPT